MRIAIPRLYLGTMTFGWSSQTSSIIDDKIALEMTKLFCKMNQEKFMSKTNYIDTARIYGGGKTEAMVGRVISKIGTKDSSLKICTKAHPQGPPGGLSPKGMKEQMSSSLAGMNTIHTFEEYYLHQPDTKSSLSDSLEVCFEMCQLRFMNKIGLSNYHVTEVKRAFDICHKEGWPVKPSVYQGLYNPLNRLVEDELIPYLHSQHCSFIAYNPLAGGLLTGKHVRKEEDEEVPKGRFRNNKNYLPRFYTNENFEAVEMIRKACEKEDITMIEATYRWLLRHSALKESNGDGILIGASSLKQLEENMNACSIATYEEEGKLPDSILQAMDEAWELTKETAFPYWRSYSMDMPNRESLDQGASYDAVKKA